MRANESNSSNYQLPLFALSVQNNGALSTVPFTATARLLQSVVLKKKRNTRKTSSIERVGGTPRNAKRNPPPTQLVIQKERQAFHVPSSRSALSAPPGIPHTSPPPFFFLGPGRLPPSPSPAKPTPRVGDVGDHRHLTPLLSRAFSLSAPARASQKPPLPPTPREEMQPKANKKPKPTKPKQNNAAQAYAQVSVRHFCARPHKS